jgi:hypothetical protein
MNALGDVVRYHALDRQADELLAQAREADPESAAELFADALAARRRMLELAAGTA